MAQSVSQNCLPIIYISLGLALVYGLSSAYLFGPIPMDTALLTDTRNTSYHGNSSNNSSVQQPSHHLNILIRNTTNTSYHRNIANGSFVQQSVYHLDIDYVKFNRSNTTLCDIWERSKIIAGTHHKTGSILLTCQLSR